MSRVNPVASGASLHSRWQLHRKDSAPDLPTSWTATVLLSAFGDSISPLDNYLQLVVGTIEVSSTPDESWLRARLYLTQSLKYFDFVFTSEKCDGIDEYKWYWIDSTPHEAINDIYGPFQTILQIPGPELFSQDDGTSWGNRYPLMCTDTHPKKGIKCDHWTDGHNWYAFRRNNLFRILSMDSRNLRKLPILGSYFIANIPKFTRDVVSESSKALIRRIKTGAAQANAYWNPMITQEDIHRAMAFPLASVPCTPQDIEIVLPGFSAQSARVEFPRWTDKLYIEGWALAEGLIPYRTRVCYAWTGDDKSKQQSFFIGPAEREYHGRVDTCLRQGTTLVFYHWEDGQWMCDAKQHHANPSGPPVPDWPARGVVMGQIVDNPAFGLDAGDTLSLIAVTAGDRVFWAWFLQNDVGMLFSEGTYEYIPDRLYAIDYESFMRNAPLTEADFSFPPAIPRSRMERSVGATPVSGTELREGAHGHAVVRFPRIPRTRDYP